ncbi:hypothetical protein GCM10009680_47410 [Streptomyces yatensis]|uniref:Uncharacterized protein n=1 Tax=Streptomyces yatensis TaxID=155177 RepID=A0ABN2I9N1_9ACTN
MHARNPLSPLSGRSSPPSPRARLAAPALAAALSAPSLSGGGSASGAGSADVTMWTFKQQHVAGLRAAAAEFGEKTGIRVRIEGPGSRMSSPVSTFRSPGRR